MPPSKSLLENAKLQVVIKSARKMMDDSSALAFGDQTKELKRGSGIKITSTGVLPLDVALGVGGWARGRIYEVIGRESGGKSSLALHSIAAAQQAGQITAFIDAEHALDLSYARKLGVNTGDMLLGYPSCAEDALGLLVALIESGEVGTVVLDSVAAMVPKVEDVGDVGDAHVGVVARLMSQTLRKLVAKAPQTGTTVIFVNQYRLKIGCVSPETFITWRRKS